MHKMGKPTDAVCKNKMFYVLCCLGSSYTIISVAIKGVGFLRDLGVAG